MQQPQEHHHPPALVFNIVRHRRRLSSYLSPRLDLRPRDHVLRLQRACWLSCFASPDTPKHKQDERMCDDIGNMTTFLFVHEGRLSCRVRLPALCLSYCLLTCLIASVYLSYACVVVCLPVLSRPFTCLIALRIMYRAYLSVSSSAYRPRPLSTYRSYLEIYHNEGVYRSYVEQ